MSHPIVPWKTYVLVFAGLLGLTALTTTVAYANLGELNTVVALGIACAKMLLVIFYFMHLRQTHGLPRIALLAGFFWLALLMAFTFSDYRTRNWTPVPSAWSTSAPPTHP
jgi:cytochrome c oxidase subunit 4